MTFTQQEKDYVLQVLVNEHGRSDSYIRADIKRGKGHMVEDYIESIRLCEDLMSKISKHEPKEDK